MADLGGDHQVQAGGAELLNVVAAVRDTALLESEELLCRRVSPGERSWLGPWSQSLWAPCSTSSASRSARRQWTTPHADVGLPNGMNGRQLAEAAREGVLGLPVLFISGYAGTSLPPGIDLIDKPFELDVLVRRVRTALEVGQRTAADRHRGAWRAVFARVVQ
jgi:hypothetical protein